MCKAAKALPDVDERKTEREKGLPKSHFTEKATLKLKTRAIVETILSAVEDLQMNEVPKVETQKLSYENTCGKFLHLVQLWPRSLSFNAVLGRLGTVSVPTEPESIFLTCCILDARAVEAERNLLAASLDSSPL